MKKKKKKKKKKSIGHGTGNTFQITLFPKWGLAQPWRPTTAAPSLVSTTHSATACMRTGMWARVISLWAHYIAYIQRNCLMASSRHCHPQESSQDSKGGLPYTLRNSRPNTRASWMCIFCCVHALYVLGIEALVPTFNTSSGLFRPGSSDDV